MGVSPLAMMGMHEQYPWMKEKKSSRKNQMGGESIVFVFIHHEKNISELQTSVKMGILGCQMKTQHICYKFSVNALLAYVKRGMGC